MGELSFAISLPPSNPKGRLPESLSENDVTTLFWAGRLALPGKAIFVIGWDTNLQLTRGMTNRLRDRVLAKMVEIHRSQLRS